MAKGPAYKVKFRRFREGKTDYHLRLGLLKYGKPRAIVRISNKYITVQFAEYSPQGDKIISSTWSKELKILGWKYSCKSVPAAYLTGYYAGLKAKKLNILETVVDIGLKNPTKGARIFAVVKGLLNAGLKVPHNSEIFPSEERIYGTHINKDIKKEMDILKQNLDTAL